MAGRAVEEEQVSRLRVIEVDLVGLCCLDGRLVCEGDTRLAPGVFGQARTVERDTR